MYGVIFLGVKKHTRNFKKRRYFYHIIVHITCNATCLIINIFDKNFKKLILFFII